MQSHIERNSSLGYSLKKSDISAPTPTENKKKKIRKVKARWTHTSHEVITKGNTNFTMEGYSGHQEIRP